LQAELLDKLDDIGASYDTETWLAYPKSVAPLVCGSIATKDGARYLTADEARASFRQLLEPGYVYIGAFCAYDMIVHAQDAAERGEDLLPAIFAKYNRGEVYDILLAQMVDAIALGCLGQDPETGRGLISPNTGKPTKRYSLDLVNQQVFNASAKENDFWRLRYYLLRNIPFSKWPPEALQYLIDDVVNPRYIALAQCGLIPRGDGRIRKAQNLHTLAKMARTSLALNLGATWGFAIDKELIATLERETLETIEAGRQQFIDAGMLKWNKSDEKWSKNLSTIKRMVAESYGGTDAGSCPVCTGSGRVPGANWKPTRPDKNLKNCGNCNGTGYDIKNAPSVPMTAPTEKSKTGMGNVMTGRDILVDSGNETLVEFGAWTEQDKIISTYIPALQAGLPLLPNVPLANERVSYSGIVQTMPRGGRVRECVIAREGRTLASVDFAGVELCTVSQVCIWTPGIGYSDLGDAINAGKDPHSILGADLLGMAYEVFMKQRAAGVQIVKDARQAAKWGNFGYFGGMGVPTFVITNRKAPGITTKAPDGRTYKGIRFCLLIGGKERCGEEIVLSWKDRPTNIPLCKACCECAATIRDAWFSRWSEARKYFRYVSNVVDSKGYVKHYGSDMIRGGVTFTSAANTYFSSLAAVGATNALWRASEISYCDRNDPLYDTRIIAFVHDELVAEVFDGCAHAAATRLGEVMVEEMQKVVPDIKIKAEPALMKKFFKGAEPVYNDNQELVPWWPEEKAA
jgi:hypothetical protein